MTLKLGQYKAMTLKLIIGLLCSASAHVTLSAVTGEPIPLVMALLMFLSTFSLTQAILCIVDKVFSFSKSKQPPEKVELLSVRTITEGFI